MKGFINKYAGGILILGFIFTLTACGGQSQESAEQTGETDTTATTQSMTANPPEAKLNINTASGDAFRTIPNVGDQMVHEFEEYRPYVSIQQFRQEIGKYVDEQQVAAYEEYIYVPVDANESDAATLQQIPGLDSEEAEALISGRPYDSNEAFIEALSQYVTQEELEAARSYMKS